jgi:hypothetical protein
MKPRRRTPRVVGLFALSDGGATAREQDAMTPASLTEAILTASDRMLRAWATPSASLTLNSTGLQQPCCALATTQLVIGLRRPRPRWERTWSNDDIGQSLGIAALPAEHRISCRLGGVVLGHCPVTPHRLTPEGLPSRQVSASPSRSAIPTQPCPRPLAARQRRQADLGWAGTLTSSTPGSGVTDKRAADETPPYMFSGTLSRCRPGRRPTAPWTADRSSPVSQLCGRRSRTRRSSASAAAFFCAGCAAGWPGRAAHPGSAQPAAICSSRPMMRGHRSRRWPACTVQRKA